MIVKNLYAEGGGASFYAPYVVTMTQVEFIDKYINGKFFAWRDEKKRKKFLTSKYQECQRIMNPDKCTVCPTCTEGGTESEPPVVLVKRKTTKGKAIKPEEKNE